MIMKGSYSWVAFTFLILLAAAQPGASAEVAQRKLDPRLQTFFKAKERQARALTKGKEPEVSPDVWAYFEAGGRGDWAEVRAGGRSYAGAPGSIPARAWMNRSGHWRGPRSWRRNWLTRGFPAMDVKFIDAFAGDVIHSIPRGSIYFGGRIMGAA